MLLWLAFPALADPIDLSHLEEDDLTRSLISADMLKTTCDAGDLVSCHRLARRDQTATPPAEPAVWAALYDKACMGGIFADCGYAGWAYANLGVADRAAAVAQKGCDAKDTASCFVLGHLEVVGLGVPAAPVPGLNLVKSGCDAKIPEACLDLGMMYAGLAPSVPADYPKAEKVLGAACDANGAQACGTLGYLVLVGKLGAADGARGVTLLTKACNGGDFSACGNLGGAYLQGIGVPKDLAKARPWLQKGCDNKDAKSCGGLATLELTRGDAGRADGLKWGKLACTYGDQDTCQSLQDACKSGATDACK